MNYYIIYLQNGQVVDISSWDEEDSRDRQFDTDSSQIEQGRSIQPYGFLFNDVQQLDQIR